MANSDFRYKQIALIFEGFAEEARMHSKCAAPSFLKVL